MSLYKERPLIPGEPIAPDKSPATTPEGAAPLARTTGAVTAEYCAAPVAIPKASPEIWRNGRWAVTEAGLESLTRAGPHATLVFYPVPADQLLRTRPDLPGVSTWAMQMAGKSWVDDVDPLLEALAQALRIHHPRQTNIDMVATAREARREWERSHRPNAGTDALGWEYVPGEATIRAVEARAAAGKEEAEGDDRPNHDAVPDFVEADEVEPPLEFDDLVEEQIDDAIEKRHR